MRRILLVVACLALLAWLSIAEFRSSGTPHSARGASGSAERASTGGAAGGERSSGSTADSLGGRLQHPASATHTAKLGEVSLREGGDRVSVGASHDAGSSGAADGSGVGDAGERDKTRRSAASLIVNGRVLDPNGRGIAGASVAARHTQACSETDSTGAFTLSLPAGNWEIWARAFGYRESHTTSSGAQAIELTLEPGLELLGRVESDSGEAIADAAILLHAASDESWSRMARRTARSDAAGAFALDGLAPGTHLLEVAAPGYTPARRTISIEETLPPPIAVKLLAGRTILATVLDGDGWPLPDATLHCAEGGSSSQRVRAGEDGLFRIAASGTKPLTVRAECPGYLHTEERFGPFTEEAPAIEIRMQPERRVAGVLRDGETNAAVSGARLTALEGRAISGADGSFSIGVPNGGPHELRVLAEGYVPGLFVIPADTQALGELLLERGGELVLSLSDETGRPIREVLVRLVPDGGSEMDGRAGRSDERGRAVVSGLPAGRYNMRATHIEFVPREEPVTISQANSATLAWKLARGARLNGVVETASALVLEGRRLDLAGSGARYSAYLDERGVFDFTRLPAGDYELTFPDAAGVSEKVTLDAGETRTLRLTIE